LRLVSVNVGTPQRIGTAKGEPVFSGIRKEPVDGPVFVRRLGIEGDAQADLKVHGGVEKAVYSYPSEHYAFWRQRFPEMEMGWGSFGENLTTEGTLEESVRIGDSFRVGGAEMAVTMPRLPCFKLGLRFGTPTILRQFLESGRTGFYLKVLKEGEISAGDAVVMLSRSKDAETLSSALATRLKNRE